MEKIHNGRAIKTEKVDKAEKGTVTVRQRGNSYEARVRLELKKVMKGVEKNPRLSRSGPTEEIARRRLAQFIIDTYLINLTDGVIKWYKDSILMEILI